MSYILVLKAIHLIGAVLWIGGVVTVAAVAMGLPEKIRSEGAKGLRTGVAHVVNPGMALAFLGGLGMLLPNFSTLYAKQGWVHAKILLVLILAGLTGVISGTIRRSIASGTELPVGKLRVLGLVSMLLAAVAIVLATLRPF